MVGHSRIQPGWRRPRQPIAAASGRSYTGYITYTISTRFGSRFFLGGPSSQAGSCGVSGGGAIISGVLTPLLCHAMPRNRWSTSCLLSLVALAGLVGGWVWSHVRGAPDAYIEVIEAGKREQ